MEKDLEVDGKLKQCFNELEIEYEKYPFVTNKKLFNFVSKNDTKNILGNKIAMKIMIPVLLFIIFYGLIMMNLDIDDYGYLIIGTILFLTGFYFASQVKYLGLIFLLFQEITGIIFLIYPSLSNIFSMPYISDNPINVYIYLAISLLIILVAIIFTIIYNLNPKIRLNKFALPINLSLYFIGMFMILILPNIISNIISWRI